jgi:branched-subunit amino acid transport protein AzlD
VRNVKVGCSLERAQIWGIVEIVLGILVAALCSLWPEMWLSIVLGVLVLIFGVLTLIHAKPKPAPTGAEKKS